MNTTPIEDDIIRLIKRIPYEEMENIRMKAIFEYIYLSTEEWIEYEKQLLIDHNWTTEEFIEYASR